MKKKQVDDNINADADECNSVRISLNRYFKNI